MVSSSSFRRRGTSNSGRAGFRQFNRDHAFDVLYPKEDVLWFDIGMDDVALVMHIFESKEHLSSNLLHERDRDRLISISTNKAE